MRFKALRSRDALKEELCRQHGVHLIVISYHVRRDDIAAFLFEHLESHLPPPDTAVTTEAAVASSTSISLSSGSDGVDMMLSLPPLVGVVGGGPTKEAVDTVCGNTA